MSYFITWHFAYSTQHSDSHHAHPSISHFLVKFPGACVCACVRVSLKSCPPQRALFCFVPLLIRKTDAAGGVAASISTPVGFDPTRGDPIGLAGRRLNHSAKVSYDDVSKTWQQNMTTRRTNKRSQNYVRLVRSLPFGIFDKVGNFTNPRNSAKTSLFTQCLVSLSLSLSLSLFLLDFSFVSLFSGGKKRIH